MLPHIAFYTDQMNSHTHAWQLAVAAVLLAGTLGACRPEPAVDQILTPANLDFEELFTLEETIRLDTAVIIGHTWMLDVNSDGELLVQDN